MGRITSTFLILTCFALHTWAQESYQVYLDSMEAYHQRHEAEFRDTSHSPLRDAAVHFSGHDFFPVDTLYRVKAKLIQTKKAREFLMPTSNPEIQKPYVSFAILSFQIGDSTYELTAYKSLRLAKMKEYKDYYFVPFKDATNGIETYGGGRYIDLTIGKRDKEIVLDFNKSYNPYCAYSDGWSCPIPPDENHLPIRIEAGIKDFQDHQ